MNVRQQLFASHWGKQVRSTRSRPSPLSFAQQVDFLCEMRQNSGLLQQYDPILVSHE